ncbi:MAG: carboxymuconolactone decarboxylase family protein [Gemmatimonadaceae bacterium]|nr:carboxymuconolactone decarboxylase family protein [Gemmatimonadaceae bacterium]NUQ93078.1 carboxymuconolactone decarboxylase family protein [Gemmatimonadaceae bacterium]NUR18470.1 carboxymuconolactone decarboxylase family protein [Gemmatimonadaceae bacterium]NUS99133.1 carboxymuconolactone decarboxylase family protein [Gemmatimonadaceae bacterium]
MTTTASPSSATASATTHGERRLDFSKAAPGAAQAQLAMERYVRGCGLEHSLLELVKLRASYMNGCAYCVDMHSKDARAEGETEQRIYAIPVWRETPFFTPRERAALAFTEAVTAIGHAGVPDDVYDEARAHFADAELANLTMAVIVINGWNRLSVTFRTPPGSYTRPK